MDHGWNREGFDEIWYGKVVNACGLGTDFELWRDGDETVVGDQGVQCSGGQRARFGFARALYRDADVLVADDPLSAVDARVGRQIFNEVIMELALKRGKCVILAPAHCGFSLCFGQPWPYYMHRKL